MGDYNDSMGFKAGLLVGLGVGYWFGAKAGEQRYEQLEAMADRLRTSQTYRAARERASERVSGAMEDGLARARGLIEDAAVGKRGLVQPEIFDQDLRR